MTISNKTITRRAFVRGGAAGTLAAGLYACGSNDKTSEHGVSQDGDSNGGQRAASKLAIIHTTDTHGHDILDEESLGMAAVAQLKSDWEAKGYEVLLLDAGDAVQGDNLVNRSQGRTAIEFMNQVGYDAMALGNHEFDYGRDRLEELAESATFPLLSANTIADDTGDTLVDANAVFTLKDGRKVGVFALTTPESATKSNPLAVRGLTFYSENDLYACAQRQVNELRSMGCELVVCLGHLGENDENKPNRAQDVIKNISGLDVFINGHDHVAESTIRKDADGNAVLVTNAECYTHLVGVVAWEDNKLTSIMVRFGEYAGQDPEVAGAIDAANEEVQQELQEVVATTPFVLNGEEDPGVRTEETNLGDLVADALLWKAQQSLDVAPDCSVMTGGGIRQSLAAGDVTLYDVLNVLPYPNYVCAIELSGTQLLEALEAACQLTPESLGAFPQVSGIEFVIDTSVKYKRGEQYPNSTYYAPAAPGARVTVRTINGKVFDEKKKYTVASIDFLCAGGNTYHAFSAAAQDHIDVTDSIISDALVDYLRNVCDGEVDAVYADPQSRITLKRKKTKGA